MNQSTKRSKGYEGKTIPIGVNARIEAFREPYPEKGVICSEKKFYTLPLPYTYKETELSEELNDGMEWVLRDYGGYLK